MKNLFATSFLLLFSVFASAAEDSAEAAALHWLSLIDSGQYSQSWDASAVRFQASLTSEDWVKALNGVRKPFGELLSRKVKKAKRRSSLPGAPDGEYTVFTMKSQFENKKKAIETLTLVKTGTQWKAVGYFIK